MLNEVKFRLQSGKNLYQGQKIKLAKIEKQTKDTKLYTFKTSKKFQFIPGQFVMLSVPGVGEAPFSPCSSPLKESYFQLSIRKVGLVTKFLDKMTSRDTIEFRGPYGNGFPVNKMIGKDLVLMAGGIAIAPISALIEYLISRKRSFGKVYLLYGVKKAEDLLFKDKLKKWQKKINVMLCAEEIDKNWEGETGTITDLYCDIKTNPEKTIVIMCGPPIMYKFVVKKLVKLKIKPEQIYVSMEARMKCGIGKCQHCTIGKYYTCLDGPVFRYSEIVKELES